MHIKVSPQPRTQLTDGFDGGRDDKNHRVAQEDLQALDQLQRPVRLGCRRSRAGKGRDALRDVVVWQMVQRFAEDLKPLTGAGPVGPRSTRTGWAGSAQVKHSPQSSRPRLGAEHR